MAYVQGKSALQRGATVAGPGVNHRSVIISADTKDMLPLGIVKVKSPEFQDWIKHEVTMSGDLNLTVQIDNTRAGSPMVPQSDPGPYLTSGVMRGSNKSSSATFYRPSQTKEIFDKLDRVSVEYNTTNGRTYWYGTLEDVKGFCSVATLQEIATQDYILTPGRYVGIEEQEDDGEPFEEKMTRLTSELSGMFEKSHELENEIRKKLGVIGYEI